jgi:hypothetical protein
MDPAMCRNAFVHRRGGVSGGAYAVPLQGDRESGVLLLEGGRLASCLRAIGITAPLELRDANPRLTERVNDNETSGMII